MIRRAAGKVIARAGCPTSSALLTDGRGVALMLRSTPSTIVWVREPRATPRVSPLLMVDRKGVEDVHRS
jgi:hypothetical protein